MGHALRDGALTAPPEVADETRREIDELFARAVTRRRSWRARLAVAAVALAAIGLTAQLAACSLTPGELTPGRTLPIVLAAWGAFELACALHRRLGPAHPAARFAAALDEGCRSAALMGLLVLAGSAAGLFLLVSLARGCVFHPEPEAKQRRTRWLQTGGHLAVALACLAAGRHGSAVVVMLALVAYFIVYGMTVNAQARLVRARVERDRFEQALLGAELGNLRGRLAREIHDGVGADIMALVLQLRRASAVDPEALALANEAQAVLEDLRGVVWSLKKEQGTFGELAKLLDAKCARLCGSVPYEKLTLEVDAQQPIASETALTFLQAAPELVRAALAQGTPTRVHFALGARAAIELRLEWEGPSLPVDAPALAPTRSWLESRSASLAALPRQARSGSCWVLTAPA